MLTKLTLTIDDTVVTKAKRYAKQKNRSVSRIVEEYLDGISDSTAKASLDYASPAPITNKVAGMFSRDYAGQDDRELLEAAILERNL